jgi:hypothetical protein
LLVGISEHGTEIGKTPIHHGFNQYDFQAPQVSHQQLRWELPIMGRKQDGNENR